VNGSPGPWRRARTAQPVRRGDRDHEYGLYAAPTATRCWTSLAGLQIPSIVIAHTILSGPPTPAVHSRAVAAMANHVVVCRTQLEARLCSRFDVDPAIIATIPHGGGPDGRTRTSPGRGRHL